MQYLSSLINNAPVHNNVFCKLKYYFFIFCVTLDMQHPSKSKYFYILLENKNSDIVHQINKICNRFSYSLIRNFKNE